MLPANVEHFREHGYVIEEGFFSKTEVAAMRAEIERFKKEGLLRNVSTDGDGKTPSGKDANLQLCPMSPHSLLFRALPFEPKVLDAVTDLIGTPIVLRLDQVFLKPAGHGIGTSWHQDNAYFKIPEPLKGTAMWIAVHDANIENGTLHVIPDAFEETVEHERDPMSDHHIRFTPPEGAGVACELEAGGVVFFCYGTPHCTKTNNSGSERAGAAFHFLHLDYEREPGVRKSPPHRPVLTGPGASDGTEEYGEPVAGSWEKHVASLVSN